MRILVTGSAGFIGFHVAKRLLDEGHQVVGLDGFTPYYDISLKESRNALLVRRNGFQLHRIMLEDMPALERVRDSGPIDAMIHLAGQAGVRYGIDNPRSYIDANLLGTFNVLELVRSCPVGHLLLASTSSVYGANTVMPFHEADRVNHPMSLYAATKASNELISHSYSHLWHIPTTSFRFFTVYGPWGRPDMALFKFTRNIIEGTPIEVFNHGKMERDFTYVDDLVEAICRLLPLPPPKPGDGGRAPEETSADPTLSPVAPYRVVNIGGGRPLKLLDFIEEIEKAVGRKSVRKYVGMQPGDIERTFASSAELERLTGYRPQTPISVGVKAFVDWYRSHYEA